MTPDELPHSPTGDPLHPTPTGIERYILVEHEHDGRHDRTDEWCVVTARAVLVEFFGPAVEVGPWSFAPDEARLLSASLAILADIADGRPRR